MYSCLLLFNVINSKLSTFEVLWMHNYNNEGRLEQVNMLASQMFGHQLLSRIIFKYSRYSNNYHFIQYIANATIYVSYHQMSMKIWVPNNVGLCMNSIIGTY